MCVVCVINEFLNGNIYELLGISQYVFLCDTVHTISS